MSNVQGLVSSFKTDVLNGVHAFSSAYRTADTFKAALYLTTASQSSSTTAYTTTNELSGSGYTATGTVVTNTTPPALSGTTAYWTPSGNFVWGGLTSSAAFDCAVLYNASSSGKNAVSVHTFGAQNVVAGTFTLTMPVNGASTALLILN